LNPEVIGTTSSPVKSDKAEVVRRPCRTPGGSIEEALSGQPRCLLFGSSQLRAFEVASEVRRIASDVLDRAPRAGLARSDLSSEGRMARALAQRGAAARQPTTRGPAAHRSSAGRPLAGDSRGRICRDRPGPGSEAHVPGSAAHSARLTVVLICRRPCTALASLPLSLVAARVRLRPPPPVTSARSSLCVVRPSAYPLSPGPLSASS
jgi:hypothetical protein